jgi:hypothetical protein
MSLQRSPRKSSIEERESEGIGRQATACVRAAAVTAKCCLQEVGRPLLALTEQGNCGGKQFCILNLCLDTFMCSIQNQALLLRVRSWSPCLLSTLLQTALSKTHYTPANCTTRNSRIPSAFCTFPNAVFRMVLTMYILEEQVLVMS